MPVGVRQFTDGNGAPLVSGWVAYAQVGTGGAVLRTVYADEGETIPLQNPVPLDASGRPYSGGSQCSIWGDGAYQEYVYDSNGVLQTSAIIDTQSSPAVTTAATGSGERIGAQTTPETELPRVLRQHQQLSAGLGFPITQGGLGYTDEQGFGEVAFDTPFTALGTVVATPYDPESHGREHATLTIRDFSASGFKVEIRGHHKRREFFWIAAGT